MRILGVDPGTHLAGAGVIESSGNHYKLVHFETITVDPKLPSAKKLQTLYEALSQIIKDYRPDVLALENVFYHRNIHTVIKIGEARACAMLAASEQGIDVVEYPPARIKQSVSGNGQATKEQMQQMVRRLLNLKTAPPADGADALAVAICHLHSHRTLCINT